MKKTTFSKQLQANDIGTTGGHQAGIHIPKGQSDLLQFLPRLNHQLMNPDYWLNCLDEAGNSWRLRYVYYNNKLHTPGGTRNEFRITHLTKFFREHDAKIGDLFEISKDQSESTYLIRIVKFTETQQAAERVSMVAEERPRIKISGWRQVH